MNKKLLYAFLYFSEGAPIGFIWWTLPAILSVKGWSLTEITALTARATLPWSFKFIFSPFIDLISHRLFILRQQVFFYQILMGLTALSFSWAINQDQASIFAAILVLHSLSAASQDICIVHWPFEVSIKRN